MTERQNISSGTPWEAIVGYSRAVRVDNHIWVAGTTATDAQGKVVFPNDAGQQTRYILQKIERALVEAGASLQDVVRTRIFVTNMNDWEAIGHVHGEFFGDASGNIRPASTLLEVSQLVDPLHLVEIEADAYVSNKN